jgi:flavin reductase (DIM6/NTAB) family NADH-FMN oxidoreductase RutF
MVIAPCVAYSAINERYAPRATLSGIRRSHRFGCGVPYIHDAIIKAIRYAGNISFALDSRKVAHSGLKMSHHEWAPLFPALPIHYDCEVVGEVRMGTHIMFLGEVRRIRVRDDVSVDNPLEWYPSAEIDVAYAMSNR